MKIVLRIFNLFFQTLLYNKKPMFLKVLIISIVLLALMMLALGIKLLFDRNAEMISGSCSADVDRNGKISCGCGGACYTGTDEERSATR